VKNTIMIVAMFVNCMNIVQASDTRGTSTILEGKKFVLGFPNYLKGSSEKDTNWSIQICIRSHYNGTVNIFSSGGDVGIPLDRTFPLVADSIVTMSIPRTFVESVVGEPDSRGVVVTADVPIAVTSYQRTRSIMESIQHIPVRSWGIDHMVASIYQDQSGTPPGTVSASGEFVIVASEDNTVVRITPTYALRAGITSPVFPANTTNTITLQKNQTVLMLGAESATLTRDWRSDITGTRIQSSKPVAVISGHQRGALLRYPNMWTVSGTTFDGVRIRNLLCEAMIPTALAGTSFVCAPIRTDPDRRPNAARPGQGADDERGDVLQFIATQDTTTISVRNADGTLRLLTTLQARASYRIDRVDTAAEYVCSRLTHCIQYGKAYASSTLVAGKFDASTSMMQVVPPVARWIDRCVLATADVGVDQFLTLVCRADQASRIVVDGADIATRWAADRTTIAGTPYVAYRVALPSDTSYVYRIAATADSVRFMVWNYGARVANDTVPGAFGSPVAMDMSLPCSDTIVLDQSGRAQCGQYELRATLKNPQLCGGLYDMFLTSKDNMEMVVQEQLNKSYLYASLQATDLRKPASATVLVRAVNGTWLQRTFRYQPDVWKVDSTKMNFGLMNAAEKRCKLLHIVNTSADSTLRLTDMHMQNPNSIFTVDRDRLTLAPGDSADIEICCSMTAFTLTRDTLRAEVNCHEMLLTAVEVDYQQPRIYVRDLTFDSVLVADSASRVLTIRNVGTTSFVWTGYDSVALASYRAKSGPYFWIADLPGTDTLQPGDSAQCTVWYAPRGEKKTHCTDMLFKTIPRSIRNSVRLCGTGYQISTTGIADDARFEPALRISAPTPHPVRHGDRCSVMVQGREGTTVTLTLVDACGRSTLVGTVVAGSAPQPVELDLASFASIPGAYSIVASDGLTCSQTTILSIP
jgi:hypothetical protein